MDQTHGRGRDRVGGKIVTRPKIMYRCPHCGAVYNARNMRLFKGGKIGLVPVHGETAECDGSCPGSLQVPRNAKSDLRFLWNGERPKPLEESETL